jgi:hypothetical protein
MEQRPRNATENNTQESLALSSSNKLSHNGWSIEYFDNFAQWQGEPLERPEPLPLEERLQFADNIPLRDVICFR